MACEDAAASSVRSRRWTHLFSLGGGGDVELRGLKKKWVCSPWGTTQTLLEHYQCLLLTKTVQSAPRFRVRWMRSSKTRSTTQLQLGEFARGLSIRSLLTEAKLTILEKNRIRHTLRCAHTNPPVQTLKELVWREVRLSNVTSSLYYGTVLFFDPHWGFGLRTYCVCSYGHLPRDAFAASESETPQCFTYDTHKTEDAETFRRFAKKRNHADVSHKFIFLNSRLTAKLVCANKHNGSYEKSKYLQIELFHVIPTELCHESLHINNSYEKKFSGDKND
jgi:hypothetical protein